MRLILTDDEGTVLESFELSRELPLNEQSPDVFEAIKRDVCAPVRERVEAELEAYARRSDAEWDAQVRQQNRADGYGS